MAYNTILKGFYDQERNNPNVKGFLLMIFRTREERRNWREYCIREGYGTKETMEYLLPDQGEGVINL